VLSFTACCADMRLLYVLCMLLLDMCFVCTVFICVCGSTHIWIWCACSTCFTSLLSAVLVFHLQCMHLLCFCMSWTLPEMCFRCCTHNCICCTCVPSVVHVLHLLYMCYICFTYAGSAICVSVLLIFCICTVKVLHLLLMCPLLLMCCIWWKCCICY
jgi:hypothetical protein